MALGVFITQLYRDVRSQKMRTALTVFGILWGTASVVLLLAFGQGLHASQQKAFRGLGEDQPAAGIDHRQGVVVTGGGDSDVVTGTHWLYAARTPFSRGASSIQRSSGGRQFAACATSAAIPGPYGRFSLWP